MKLKKAYLYISILSFLLVIVTIGEISAYSYQIPVCNSTNISNVSNTNVSCVPIIGVSSITNAPQAMIYYQNGNLYITNETGINYTIIYNSSLAPIHFNNYTNMSVQNITNITYYTYMINNSNGSSYTFQQNISLNNDYVRSLFNQLYSDTNFSKFYNRTEMDTLLSSQLSAQLTTLTNNLGSYATKGELVNLDLKMANVNTINWTSFNLTRINEYMDNGGDFNITWKVVVIFEGVVILLLLIFVAKTMMSGGGDY